MAKRKAELVIAGDNKGGVKALRGTGDAAGGVSKKLAGIGKAGTLAFAALGAAAIGGVVLLGAVGKEFDEAYDKIRAGTGATGESMDGLKDSFRQVLGTVPADADSVSTAIADINTRLGLTGEALEARSAQLLNLSRITDTDVTANIAGAADVLNNFGIAAEDQEKTLDNLFVVSQATGVGFTDLTSDLASNGVVLRELGFDANSAAALLGTLGQAGIDTADVTSGLKRSLAAAAEAGIPADQAFRQLLDGIKGAPNAGAAATLAIDSLGTRSGPQFAAMVREGTLGYDDLLASLDGGADTINGVAAENASFGESFQLLKNNVMLALEAPAAEVFEAIGDAVTALTPTITVLAELFAKGLSGIVEMVGPLLEIVLPIFEELMVVIQGVGMTMLEELMPPVMKLFEALAPLIPVLAELVGSIIGAVAPVLGALVEALVPVVEILVEALSPVIESLQPMFGTLGEVLVMLVEALAPLLPSLVELGASLIPLLPPLVELIALILEGLMPLLLPLIEYFVEFAMVLTDVLTLGITWIVEKIALFIDWLARLVEKPEEARAAFSAGIGKIGDMIGNLVDWFAGLGGKLADIAKGMFLFLPNQFIDALNKLVSLWNNFRLGPWDLPTISTPFGETPGGRIGPWDTPDIPTLPRIAAESGALLTAPTVVLAGESAKARRGGGEIVSPAGMMRDIVRAEAGGGGGPTIVVQGNLYGDPRAFGRAVVEALDTHKRSGGRVPVGAR